MSWTKMDDGSWRHDGCGMGQNKLNVFLKDTSVEPKPIGDHISDVKNPSADAYLVVYTVNDAPSEYDSGSHILSEHSTKSSAMAAAQDVKQNNPETAPIA